MISDTRFDKNYLVNFIVCKRRMSSTMTESVATPNLKIYPKNIFAMRFVYKNEDHGGG